jgi:trimeric autotransporter adhesin
MSTKTNFKRIALVAVAALGLGVLSSAPSQAAVSALSVTVTDGTATAPTSDSTTAGLVAISFLANAQYDSATVSFQLIGDPGKGTAQPVLMVRDTGTVSSVATNAGQIAQLGTGASLGGDTVTAGVNKLFIGDKDTSITTTSRRISVTLGAQLQGEVFAGTYTIQVTVTPPAATGAATVKEVKIVVAGQAAVNAGASTSVLQAPTGGSSSATVDSVVTSTSAISSTNAARAIIYVTQKSAAGSTTVTNESFTVTTNIGTLGTASTTPIGRSIVVDYTGSTKAVYLFSDGTAGAASITVTAATAGLIGTESVVFYSATVASITGANDCSAIGASNSDCVYGNALDSLKNSIPTSTSVYAYSSDTTVVTNNGTACTWDSTYKTAFCSLTGIKSGTANITLRDKSTVALSTVASDAIPVTVNLKPAATIKLSFDKANYAPNEKALVRVTAFDSDGKVVAPSAYTDLLATGGISATTGFGNGSDTLTAVSFSTAATSTSKDPVKQYTVYMPYGGGSVTISATGGTHLPAAGQVKVTASATVTDSGAAALAAVNALATTVASLRTLITTLTNLVLKIQKKVKA